MFTRGNEAAPIELYGHNLTRLARQGTFAPLAGQGAVARRVVQVLSRKQKCCPMILDPNEKRRLAIILEIVRQMATGEAEESFSQQQVRMENRKGIKRGLCEINPLATTVYFL